MALYINGRKIGAYAALQVQNDGTGQTAQFYEGAPPAWGHSPRVGIEGILEVDGAAYFDYAVGCKVIGSHNNADVTPLQRVLNDDAATGGNARGNFAVDLQSARSAATQVASGVKSTVSGGYANTASGYYSAVSGGKTNTASGYLSTMSGGNTNTASGDYSTVSGGNANIASGASSTMSGGNTNTASGVCSAVSGGYFAVASQYGQQAQASGRFAAAGDAQRSTMVLRRQTTTVAQTALGLDGAADSITLLEDTTYALEAHVVARRTDADNESAYYVLRWCCDRNTAGAATLVGAVSVTVVAEDTAAWDVTADCSGNDTRILVTGENAKTIRWVASVYMTEVSG